MSAATITVHSSQFPENVRRQLADSLRGRSINHKFHYDSYKQSRKWLALHEAHSPARFDPAVGAAYDRAFAGAVRRLSSPAARVIGLGCGGGQKDARLLASLARQRVRVAYTPCDTSLPLLLTASEAARAVAGRLPCDPVLCDLAEAEDLPEILDAQPNPRAARLITFFGMLPNFEPSVIMPRLAALARPRDWLLLSANLAPGPDYDEGTRAILPGYDNPLARDWLLTFLFDLGFAPEDGKLVFSIETSAEGLKRIAADFVLTKSRAAAVSGETFEFSAGEKIRLFFSYRYTPARTRALLKRHRLEPRAQWLAPSGEEGVFLCRKAGS